MSTTRTADTLYRRQQKPTVEIPRRTIAECAARYAAYQAQRDLGLPTVDLDR